MSIKLPTCVGLKNEVDRRADGAEAFADSTSAFLMKAGKEIRHGLTLIYTVKKNRTQKHKEK
jgi:hypothetical protein